MCHCGLCAAPWIKECTCGALRDYVVMQMCFRLYAVKPLQCDLTLCGIRFCCAEVNKCDRNEDKKYEKYETFCKLLQFLQAFMQKKKLVFSIKSSINAKCYVIKSSVNILMRSCILKEALLSISMTNENFLPVVRKLLYFFQVIIKKIN